MAMAKNLKERAGKYFLRKELAPMRERRGVNLGNAQSAALLYIDHDENHFKQIKAYVKQLHEVYGMKRVCALGFVDLPSKQLPVYQAQKLEYMYFTRSDLNWYLKPQASLMNFLTEPFDVLIDLSVEPCVPMHYILKASHARMKVGTSRSGARDLYDVTLRMDEHEQLADYWKHLNYYLNKAEFK
jgi:hypothetical protein